MIMPELSSVFSLVNYAFVLFFGIVAALYFADIGFCDHKRVYVLTLFFFGIAQLLFYLIMGESVLYKCYPFLIHLPLILLIFLRFHRNLSISVIAVLSAYLLCTPRKWFGTFVAFFFDRNPVVSNIASIIITIPLLVLVIRFVSPYIIRLKYESRTTLLLFFLLPLVYYVLEYTFTVYTDLLYTGGAVVIDFMDSFLVVSFFILSVLSLKFSSEKNKAERENILLTTAATQAQKEISQLSAFQQQAAISSAKATLKNAEINYNRTAALVEAGAVAAARAASTMEKERSMPSTPHTARKTSTEAVRDSSTVITITRGPFFFSTERRKNSPVLKAMKARAISERKSVWEMKEAGTVFRQKGPIRIPARI